MSGELPPDPLTILVARSLAIRDLIVVILANQIGLSRNPDSTFRQVSEALSKKASESKLDLEIAAIAQLETDWILAAAQSLYQRRPK